MMYCSEHICTLVVPRCSPRAALRDARPGGTPARYSDITGKIFRQMLCIQCENQQWARLSGQSKAERAHGASLCPELGADSRHPRVGTVQLLASLLHVVCLASFCCGAAGADVHAEIPLQKPV
jgi:hypothetical protein